MSAHPHLANRKLFSFKRYKGNDGKSWLWSIYLRSYGGAGWLQSIRWIQEAPAFVSLDAARAWARERAAWYLKGAYAEVKRERRPKPPPPTPAEERQARYQKLVTYASWSDGFAGKHRKKDEHGKEAKEWIHSAEFCATVIAEFPHRRKHYLECAINRIEEAQKALEDWKQQLKTAKASGLRLVESNKGEGQ